MAKKAKRKANKKIPVYDETLPQNIVEVGENVEEDKRIYISQSVYKKIHSFTKDKTTNESGGVLVGNVVEEFGKVHIIIRGFIEAKYCEGTPTTLKFTHESWEYIHRNIDEKYPKYKIVGWIHTHPNFGIFLSEYDKFIQNNYFNEENQIAYVIDPIQNIEGFYFWINGNIEKCKGFYVFDKVEKKIQLDFEKEDPDNSSKAKGKTGIFQNLMIAVLSVAVVILMVIVFAMNGKINTLSTQYDNLAKSYNESINTIKNNFNVIFNSIEQNTQPSTEPSTDNSLNGTTPSVENNVESTTDSTVNTTVPINEGDNSN